MAYELIHDVHQCRKEWKDALDQPFDIDQIWAIKDRYARALRAEANYRTLYAEQREIALTELRAAQATQRAEWEKLTKKALCEELGYEYPTRLSVETIIDQALFSRVNVESEHNRVKRIWAAMTQEEQEQLS
jgi:hypothetical protein